MTILLACEWKSPQLLPRTSRMLQRLIVFAVNTGTWTAAFALTSLILVYASPSTVINTIIGTAVCSVYSNTLLANLNTRESLGDILSTIYGGIDTFRFALSALPATSVEQPEDSGESSSTQKVEIVPDEDVWKSAKEDASENV
ncbi:hypothetical protein JVU11DRAFT_6628 [Chiua virens]|nr:hypothetical protein JVU11DRAFT_6628 [Chiua virens]